MSTTDSSLTTANPDTAASEKWALVSPASHFRLWTVAVLGLVADLWTKQWAFSKLGSDEVRTLIPNLASLQRSLNPGALFGLGTGFAPLFIGASVLALMFVLYLFANSSAARWSMHVGLGFVLAGALGNLYDRTTQSAFVAYYQGERGNTKEIGKLISQSDYAIEIGDFPTGANPRLRPKPSAGSGVQPVVRDFIKIEAKIGSFTLWPWVFNIADALLVVGVALLLINYWFDHRHAPHSPASP